MRSQELASLAKVVDAVAKTFGPYCEVVLHDLTRPDHSVVAIANGHVTGRRVGDSLPDADLYRLAAEDPSRDSVVGYRSHTTDGKPLRSTTVFFRGRDGLPYAALGINVDLSLARAMHEQTSFLLDDSSIRKEAPIRPGGVRHLMRSLLHEALAQTTKAATQLDRDDRVLVAKYLEEHGAFVIRGSVSAAARMLGVSRVAMYTYIEEARQQLSREAERGSERQLGEVSGG